MSQLNQQQPQSHFCIKIIYFCCRIVWVFFSPIFHHERQKINAFNTLLRIIDWQCIQTDYRCQLHRFLPACKVSRERLDYGDWWLQIVADVCMSDGREDLFSPPPPFSHPYPFSSSFLGCCGNERADLRLLSPIVPVKLLNFSTHTTVSQRCVRARKKNACMQAQPCSQEHTHSHQDMHLYSRQTHSPLVSWEKPALCLVYWPQDSVVFSLLIYRMVKEKVGPGWERTIERTP